MKNLDCSIKMTKFTSLLSPNNIRQGVISSSKKNALELAGRLLEEQIKLEDLDEVDCFTGLFNREKLGCTAIGNGVAIPRTRIPQGNKPICIFLQLASPIDYEAADNREVDLILAILVPESICESYAPTLTELSEKFRDKTFTKQLRAAQSAEEIWNIFESIDRHNEQEVKEVE